MLVIQKCCFHYFMFGSAFNFPLALNALHFFSALAKIFDVRRRTAPRAFLNTKFLVYNLSEILLISRFKFSWDKICQHLLLVTQDFSFKLFSSRFLITFFAAEFLIYIRRLRYLRRYHSFFKLIQKDERHIYLLEGFNWCHSFCKFRREPNVLYECVPVLFQSR